MHLKMPDLHVLEDQMFSRQPAHLIVLGSKGAESVGLCHLSPQTSRTAAHSAAAV